MLAQEVIRCKRDGGALSREQIDDFVAGLSSGRWSDSQAAALAMAILLRGMSTAETVALTDAMTASGEVLDWAAAQLHGPTLDKHSTGGVGDKVSLLLAPIVAACGGVVPMISGRGLGHTGGTLDKLQTWPGYNVDPSRELLHHTLREVGCAIVSASARLAPADRRLYAIRDVTATVESLPLITASILSKKRAAGLQGLVMDVKVGSGAFMRERVEAEALARSLVQVARGGGLPTVALLTDMNQVLGHTAGNALELRESIDALAGRGCEPHLREVTLALCAQLLHLGGLATTLADARTRAERAWDSGAAAERLARMVAALGGPTDVLKDAQLPRAPVQRAVPAPRAGVLAACDVRALGLVVVALGGGRAAPGQLIDPRVGLAEVLPRGTIVAVGEPIATVHAANEADAQAAVAAVQAAFELQTQPFEPGPVVIGTLED